MKVLVTGASGQLGHDVMEQLTLRRHEGIGSDITIGNGIALDITSTQAVEDVLLQVQPDAVIHCAAWTAVDAAEDAENQQKVMQINGDGTRNIAKACRDIGCKLLYISTDYVFDGKGEAPWQPDCATFAPLNVYGKSKLAGEIAVRETLENHFIVRISWAFGKTGNNFVKTMLRMGQTHDIIRVVCDQIGTPTYTEDLSRLLVDMIETDRYGTYHATNEGGYISWYDFACEIFRQAEMDCVKVLPVTTAEYGLRKAARPFNSRLDKQKLSKNGFISLPDWHDALRRYLQTAK